MAIYQSCENRETYYSYSCQGMFCPYCGMAPRRSPTDRRGKERLRLLRQKIEPCYLFYHVIGAEKKKKN